MGAFPAARLRHSGVFRARAREITSLLQVLFKSVVFSNSAALSLTSAGKAPISEAQWGIYRVVWRGECESMSALGLGLGLGLGTVTHSNSQ